MKVLTMINITWEVSTEMIVFIINWSVSSHIIHLMKDLESALSECFELHSAIHSTIFVCWQDNFLTQLYSQRREPFIISCVFCCKITHRWWWWWCLVCKTYQEEVGYDIGLIQYHMTWEYSLEQFWGVAFLMIEYNQWYLWSMHCLL